MQGRVSATGKQRFCSPLQSLVAACVLPVDKPRQNTPSTGTNGNILQGVQDITACWAKITKMSKQGTFGVLFLL